MTFVHYNEIFIWQLELNLSYNAPFFMYYLQKDPNHEKPIIFGCQWFSVVWNPSKQLVWASGESFFISLRRSLAVSILVSLSYAAVPGNKFNVEWIRTLGMETTMVQCKWQCSQGFYNQSLQICWKGTVEVSWDQAMALVGNKMHSNLCLVLWESWYLQQK